MLCILLPPTSSIEHILFRMSCSIPCKVAFPNLRLKRACMLVSDCVQAASVLHSVDRPFPASNARRLGENMSEVSNLVGD
jgi:hypothetical protein